MQSPPPLQAKIVTPTTVTTVVTADSGYRLASVTVEGMEEGTEGTPTASKGAVSNHSIEITPSVTNVGGYIQGGTKTGTPVSVTASELVSGTKQISQNGTDIDVTEFQKVDVIVPVPVNKLPQVVDRSITSLDASDFGTITKIGHSAFRECSSLSTVILPNAIANIESYAFAGCTQLTNINTPSSVTAIGAGAFYGCVSLLNFVMNEGMGALADSVFHSCSSVETGIIPTTVNRLYAAAFYNCSGLKELKFQSSTPPTVLSSNAFPTATAVTNFVYIPYIYSNAYIGATNYPTYLAKYTGYYTFTNGYTLPATDPTNTYELTWYATKADATAETNAITTGNGNEVYCRYTVA